MALMRPVPLLPLPLAALMLLAAHPLLLRIAPELDLSATCLDPAAITQGLHARVGALDGWSIRVRDAAVAGTLELHLQSPDGRSQRRRLSLAGTATEDRSRELAASLALLIEQWDDPPPPDEPPTPDAPPGADGPGPADRPVGPPATPPRLRGWLGVGPRLELARLPPLGGVDLLGGLWLAREHLQPLFSLGWAATARDGLSLHTLRFGAGLAAGAPLAGGRLWLGAHALVHGLWARAHDQRSEALWTSSSELGGLLQVRGRRWLVGVRSGVDLASPPLQIRGDRARIFHGPVHWALGVSFGVIFDPIRNP